MVKAKLDVLYRDCQNFATSEIKMATDSFFEELHNSKIAVKLNPN